MRIRLDNGPVKVLELEADDQIQLLLPASHEMACVYLEVDAEGKLIISGGASIISEIRGDGMRDKFKE